VLVEPGRRRLPEIFGHGVAGQGHQEGAPERRVRAKRPRHVVAVHPGQADVTQDDVRPEAAGLGDPLGPVVGDRDVLVLKLEQLAQRVRGVVVVLDDEDAATR